MEKKSKKGIIIGITLLLLVMLTLLGLTYAYYRTRIIGNEANTSVSVTSQKLEVKYQNESALVSATGIEPGYTIIKTFEVANTGNATATYSVWLEDMTNTFERIEDLTYTLTKNGDSITGTLSHIAVGTHQILIPSVSIDAEATDSYTLTINYKNEETIDQSDDMGSTLSFKINIQEEAVTWENSTEGTLLYSLKNASDAGTTLKTLEDDYGISNYYSGAVTNNFVNYSGMCWRIVRVQGDGTIKMALMFDDVCEKIETAEAELKDISHIFINMENLTFGSLNYEESNFPSLISSWVKSTNLDTTKLVETEFCNDTSIASIDHSTYDYNNITYNNIQKNYGASKRITDKSYTLKCNMKGLEDTSATRITSNIALLTTDEYLLAGSYLIDQDYGTGVGGGYLDWMMTPASLFMQNGEVSEYRLYDMGTNSDDHTLTYMYIRPVIAVRSDVTITDGDDGTQSNPYVIG